MANKRTSKRPRDAARRRGPIASINRPGRPVAGRPPTPTRPATNRPGSTDGISVSIGPVDDKNEVLKEWLTFPVTPTVIPVEASANWVDGIYGARPGARERSRFVGSQSRTISFAGRLEPPSFYVAEGRTAVDERLQNDPAYAYRIGEIDVDALMRMRRDIRTGPGWETPGPRRVAGARNPAVVMEAGAQAGPTFYEPHAFVNILEDLRDEGEPIRLVVGDQYGWNGQVTVRTFAWRFEDPDPDVINYDVGFKEHREAQLGTLQRKRKSGKQVPLTYRTKEGDTLARIALRFFPDEPRAHIKIRSLNTGRIAKLWFYPPRKPGRDSIGSIGRIDNRGRDVGRRVGERMADKLSVDMTFRDGIELKLRAPKPGKKKKGKD